MNRREEGFLLVPKPIWAESGDRNRMLPEIFPSTCATGLRWHGYTSFSHAFFHEQEVSVDSEGNPTNTQKDGGLMWETRLTK